MKTFSTLKKSLSRKEGWLSLLILAVVMVFGCYEFRSIMQPAEAYSNSSFEVPVVMQQDPDDENNFTDEGSPMANHGLLGVLLPEGWTVKDSIFYQVVAADSMLDGEEWKVASKDWSNSGYLLYDEDHSIALSESALAPPPGYYWWGARTDTVADMHFFDSLYYTITIMTDDQTGQFALRYAVGDEDSENRMPYDVDVVSDPMPITITEGSSGVTDILDKKNVELYPNPTWGLLNLNISDLNNTSNVDLVIYDLRGRAVLSRILDSQENILDLTGYDPGTYVVRLTAGEEVTTRKFVLY
jgi:hypothetical protein